MDPTLPPFTFSYNFILFRALTSEDPLSTPRNLSSNFREGWELRLLQSPGCAGLQLSLASHVCDSGQGIQPLPSLSFLVCKMRGVLFLSALQKRPEVTNEITYIRHPLQWMAHGRSSKNGNCNDDYFSFFTVPRTETFTATTDQIRNTQAKSAPHNVGSCSASAC